MEKEEKLFAFNTSPCGSYGHRMRTRAGHCIQCDTKKIAFIRRHYEQAYIYIAGSRRSRVIKIGCSAHPWERQNLINQLGYGGISDWRMVYYGRYENAGKVEFAVHRMLSQYSSPRSYMREYLQVDCREVFACGYPIVKQALDSVAIPILVGTETDDARASYSF
ncbi:MAG: GIY-YIG nuclease family protein [Rudaea sp.]